MITPHKKTPHLIVLLACLVTTSAARAEQFTVITNPGPFKNISQAAIAHKQVNWWDSDLSDDRACTESFAATELIHFMAQIKPFNKKDFNLQSPTKLPKNAHVFLIGSRKSNPLIKKYLPENDDTELKTNESFRIRTIKNNNRIITIIQGKDRVGTLYGTYNYLEQLGIRFFGLGEKQTQNAGKTISIPYLIQGKENELFTEPYTIPSKGTTYPTEPAALPDNLNIVENPAFITRGFWAWENNRANTEFYLWMARNRMNLWTAAEEEKHFLKKLGFQLTQGQHDIQARFLNPADEYPYNHPSFKLDDNKPNDPYATDSQYQGDTNNDNKLSYFEAHPQWYCLKDGKRSDKVNANWGGDNYCTSNADANTELNKNFIQDLIDGQWQFADSINFWMQDGGKWCQCQNCKKQGSYTDRLLKTVHTTMLQIKKAQQQQHLHRNIQLISLAYHETLAPPTQPLPENFDYDNFSITFFPIERCFAHSLADPTCTEINQSICKDYQGWATDQTRYYKGSIFIGEYYNVSTIKSMPVLFTRIMAEDVPWYYNTGAKHFHYMHAPTRILGTWTLNHYLLTKLLWNPAVNTDTIIDEYFNRYYPTTSKHTRQFYQHLEYASANIKPLKHYTKAKDLGTYHLTSRLDHKTTAIFPLEHFHYEPYSPKLNDAPDLTQIINSIQLARKSLDQAMLTCSDATEKQRLLEDDYRFKYGQAMTYFYYHLIRTEIFHRRNDTALAKNEFKQLKNTAQTLQNITDLTHVSSSHANSENGLIATQALDIYNFFKEKYDK